jgi:hypothetical protein
MPSASALDLGMRAPDLVIETCLTGRTRPKRIALTAGETRWTVLVFEPEPDAARLREIDALRPNFVAEGATLVVVAGSGNCVSRELAGTGLQFADDRGELAGAFGTDGPATFVLDDRGTVYDAHHGSGGEYVALALLQALRIGGPSMRLVEAARDAHLACAA